MTNRWLKMFSIFLSLVLIFNLLPLQVLASGIDDAPQPSLSVLPDDGSSGSAEIYERLDTLTIVEEDTSRRGEYYKEFVLNNGLRLAAVYTEPVHYTEDGEWKDIDNTLKAVSIKGIAGYTNTAGVWQVYFPQQLSGSNAISLTKDGYTVSFGMAGELTNSGGVAVASIGATSETMAATTVRTSAAQIRAVDLTEQKAAAQYEQTVLEKHSSKLAYASVYNNTEVVYDLSGNRLKESIVISKYNASLWGYRYNLNTGGLIPVLLEDNSIELRHPETAEVIMTMPAPFMVDANYEYNYDVDVSLVQRGSNYLLSYYVPRQWLASADRAWPVVLDPEVEAGTGSSNIQDISFTPTVTETYRHSTIKVGYSTTNGIYRTYLRFVDLPELENADYIAMAQVKLKKPANSSQSVPVEVHKVNQPWTDRTISWGNNDSFNSVVEDYAVVKNPAYYTWDITGIARGWYEDPTNTLANNTGMMFKTTDAVENDGVNNWHQFCSSNYGDNVSGATGTSPSLTITFRNSNGLESCWNYTSGSAGRAGVGYVNNFTGSLTWVHSDIGFGGNRMPVAISHIYNTGDAAANAFGMGYGWRTNFNQSVEAYPDGVIPYYVWDDSDGTKHYFYPTAEDPLIFQDEDGLNLTLTTPNAGYEIADMLNNTSYFDANGRLYKLENNQQTKSSINIEYIGATNQIAKVVDGVGREYRFAYGDDGLLNRIGYYSTGETEIAYIAYSYTDSNLTAVIYQDQEYSSFAYGANHLLTHAWDIDDYMLNYTYTGGELGKFTKVATVTEYDCANADDESVQGMKLTFTYAHNHTTIRDQYGVERSLHFNDWGNITSVQDDEGRAQFDQYDSNSVTEDRTNKQLNQLNTSSKLQNTVVNLLKDSSFEQGTLWTADSGVTQGISTEAAYLGNKSLKVVNSSGVQAGVTAYSKYVAPFAEYTLSAYVKTGENTSAYLCVTGGGIVAGSETLAASQDWARLEVYFYNYTGEPQTITMKLIVDGAGPVYIDCAQLEQGVAGASRLNLIDNGDFSFGSDSWIMSEKCDSDETVVLISDVNENYEYQLDQIGGYAFQIVGDPKSELYIHQELPISGDEGDIYVLSGWALGQGIPLQEGSDRTYTLRGQFLYTDGSTGKFEVDFNPSAGDYWQHTATAMVAEMAYSGIEIQVLFDYGANTVYFDNIQLFKENFGDSYRYDDNGNVIQVDSVLGETTTYSYTEGNDLSKATLPTEAESTYTYDNYHNVKTATSAEGVVYTYTYDTYGNNTAVSITVGDISITSSVAYEDDGNRVKSATDAAGNITEYSYNADTNVLEWMKAPGETDDTRTNYTYDVMYRLANVSANVNGLAEGTALTAAYSYTDDMLTSLRSGSTTYTFTYGDFALRTRVIIGNRILANYRYNDKHELEGLDYGNGDGVRYFYDRQGRLIRQYYEDDSSVTYKYDNSGLQSYVYDSASGTTTRYYYDFASRLSKMEETGPHASHTVEYDYGVLGNLYRIDDTVNGNTQSTLLGYNGDNQVTVVSASTGLRHFVYDEYGRISARQAKTYTNENVLTESFGYRTLSTAALTGQVSDHLISSVGDFALHNSYQYDQKGNIVSAGQTTYVYDSQGQLVRENNQAADKTWTYQYDNAGNIVYKREYAYTTGELGTPVSVSYRQFTDADWGDLMTVYNGTVISYDEIGNPLNDGTWTYTWVRGRQLESMTDGATTWSYEYDAGGMRIRRTDGTTAYTYVYTGSNLVYMSVGNNALRIGYDHSGSPIGLRYNGVLYYYVTNLQGDVIAILDTSGNQVVGYTYDAWGNILSTTGSMAETLGVHNPLRYRGYVYDQETGLYYLQSRYYNPAWGRFLNADAFAATGQGLLGSNMFAYCYNNPVNMIDADGYWAIDLALEFLKRWLGDDGSKVYYDEDSKVSKKLKYSTLMFYAIVAIQQYEETGDRTLSGSLEFTPEDGGIDLYLSIQQCEYEITVTRETRTRNFLFFKYSQERYIVHVEVWDEYDFDMKEWNSLGNILNNTAAILHCLGVGADYEWRASFSYVFDWKNI